jgi:hypothetical protein
MDTINYLATHIHVVKLWRCKGFREVVGINKTLDEYYTHLGYIEIFMALEFVGSGLDLHSVFS